ncbi:hypothetical protein LTR17_016150 [Elasticomyces elasticus]|nr:hypothetical protein LTR17_016150 [Elasticomyces elasticus]
MMDHTEDLTELPIAPAHGIIPVEIPAILDKGRRQMCHQLSRNIDNLHDKFNLRKKREYGDMTILTSEEVVCKFTEYGDSQMEGICMTCLMPGSLHATDCVDQPYDATTPVVSEEGWTPWLREARKPYWKPCEATTHHGWPALAIMAEAAATEPRDLAGDTDAGDDTGELKYPESGSFQEESCWYLAD